MAKRGRPSSDQHQNLPERVTVRFTEIEKLALVEMCETEGVTLAAFVRAKVFGKRISSKSDSILLNEIRRLGSLLKKLCSEGMLESDQIAPILSDIRIALNAVLVGAEVASFRNELRELARLLEKIYQDGGVDPYQILAVLKSLKQTFDHFNLGK